MQTPVNYGTAPLKTILLIDDNYNDLAITSTILHDAGYRVIIAEDAETGIKRAIFAKPDLIVLDAIMPDMNGYEACQYLKNNRHTANIPVLLKTCLNDETSVVRAYKAGADDYIVKTYTHETLIPKIANRLRQSSLEAAKSRLLELLSA